MSPTRAGHDLVVLVEELGEQDQPQDNGAHGQCFKSILAHGTFLLDELMLRLMNQSRGNGLLVLRFGVFMQMGKVGNHIFGEELYFLRSPTVLLFQQIEL